MPSPNWQRLADLGQLPKNFIQNKLWQHNQKVMKEKIRLLEEENKQLRDQLQKYSVITEEPVRVNPALRPNNVK